MTRAGASGARSAAGTGPRRTARAALRWVGRLGLVLAGLVGAELLHRGYRLATGAGYSSAATAAEVRALLLGLEGGVERDDGEDAAGDGAAAADEARAPRAFDARMLHPFTGWDTSVAFDEMAADYGATLRHARLGTRRPDVYRVWLIGGSVAKNFGHRGKGGSRIFEKLASEDPRMGGRRIQLFDYARAAYKQPQQLMLVAYLFSLGLVPDAVINLDGFNEVAIGTLNHRRGAHPVYPSLPQWAALAADRVRDPRAFERMVGVEAARQRARTFGERVLAAGAHRSSLLGTLALLRLRGLREAWYAAHQGFVGGVTEAGGDPAVSGPARALEGSDPVQVITTNWYESSRSLHALCEARGVAYLHLLQPTLHDAGSKPLTEEEVESGAADPAWIEGVQLGYPALRAAGERLVAAGVRFVDVSDAFRAVEQTLYFDACHFGSAGNRILAEHVAPVFVDAVAAFEAGGG